MPKIVGIYKITCTNNKMVYIGQSIDIKDRWGDHKYSLRKGTHDNPILRNCFNKYGVDSLVFEVVEECTKDNLTNREQYHLNEAIKANKRLVMNRGLCADNPTRGIKHPPEYGEAISKRSKGRKYSEETRKRMSEIKKALFASGWKRPEWSEETKERARQKQVEIGESRKKTIALRNPEGELITIKGINQFCRERGWKHKRLLRVLSGKAISYKGWTLTEPRERRKTLSEKPRKKGYSLKTRKTIYLRNPEGEVEEITGIKEFCNKTGIHQQTLDLLRKGKYKQTKGWTLP